MMHFVTKIICYTGNLLILPKFGNKYQTPYKQELQISCIVLIHNICIFIYVCVYQMWKPVINISRGFDNSIHI